MSTTKTTGNSSDSGTGCAIYLVGVTLAFMIATAKSREPGLSLFSWLYVIYSVIEGIFT